MLFSDESQDVSSGVDTELLSVVSSSSFKLRTTGWPIHLKPFT